MQQPLPQPCQCPQEIDNRAAVLEDIKMQMDCKLWAERFNKAFYPGRLALRYDSPPNPAGCFQRQKAHPSQG
jgi:hypothetical protein